MAEETNKNSELNTELPEPISRQDNYLSYIAIENPSREDIEELIPQSRQEEYLKYIALNGIAGGGSGADVNVVQTTGTSTTNVMSQNAVSKELDKKVGSDTTINGKPLSDNIDITAEDIGTYTKEEIEKKISEAEINIDIVQETGQSTESVMSQKAVTDAIKASGGTGVVIEQTTGDSVTSVMSQKAVSDELNKLDTKIDSKVNKDTTINGHSLDENIELSPEDIGTYSKDEIDNKIEETTDKLDKLGTAAYCDTGINSGNVPILNEEGKLNNTVIPSLAITDTFIANNEEEMLNLERAEQGDICIRTDENKTYILNEEPKKFRYLSETITERDNWIELQTPTSDVTSVNGQKGNVTITADDLNTYTKEEIERKIEESSGTDINIVQTTGTSTSDVMSQNAVTTELNKKIENEAEKDTSISIGYTIASMGGDKAVAVGKESSAHTNSVAYGYKSKALNNGIAIGCESSGNGGIAIGYQTQTTGGIAIGGSITTETATGTAIGKESQVLGHMGVALGETSVAAGRQNIALGSYSYSPPDEEYILSIGNGESNGFTRRIINVTDPKNAQDAATKKYVDDKVSGIPNINVVQTTGTSTTDVMSQKAVKDELDKKIENKTTQSTSVSIGSENTSSYSVSVGYNSKNGSSYSVSIGNGSTTSSTYSTSVGNNANSASDSVALGGSANAESSSVAVGRNSKSVQHGTAIGYSSKAYTSNSISIGYNAVAGTEGNSDGACLAVGDNSQANKNYGIAIGHYAKSYTNSSVSIGGSANAGEEDGSSTYATSLGYYSKCPNQYSVALGAYSTTDESNVVSVGQGPSGAYCKTRRIVNVSDPVNAQDAVTKNFLSYTVLFSNSSGQYGTITLSDTYTNYNKIVVYCEDNNVFNSTEFFTEDANLISCFTWYKSSSGASGFYHGGLLRFSGKTATLERNCLITISNSGTDIGNSESNGIKIIKIVGYKY